MSDYDYYTATHKIETYQLPTALGQDVRDRVAINELSNHAPEYPFNPSHQWPGQFIAQETLLATRLPGHNWGYYMSFPQPFSPGQNIVRSDGQPASLPNETQAVNRDSDYETGNHDTSSHENVVEEDLSRIAMAHPGGIEQGIESGTLVNLCGDPSLGGMGEQFSENEVYYGLSPFYGAEQSPAELQSTPQGYSEDDSAPYGYSFQ